MVKVQQLFPGPQVVFTLKAPFVCGRVTRTNISTLLLL